MEFSFGLSLGASADWSSTNWRTPLSMSDSVVSDRFLNNTYMSASYRRATRLAGWNKKPGESSVRRVLNHTLQRTGDIALLSSLRLVAAVAELGSLGL
jgi:hypothetical protein